jgi:hypothetical protein
VFVVELCFRDGKALGSEEGKWLVSELGYEQMKEVRGCTAYDRNVYVYTGRYALEHFFIRVIVRPSRRVVTSTW